MRKMIIIITVILLVTTGTILAVRFFIGGDEDNWICQKNEWVRHGNPSAPQPTSSCGITDQ